MVSADTEWETAIALRTWAPQVVEGVGDLEEVTEKQEIWVRGGICS